ncbi:UNVERIFIED_CONTAM: hypothetical protein HDU68_010688 [Siphonaria sp. JEL0065]|nr:hypothetical protein HDU68_010688 [Siphonaria sp. JEL0065]
MDPTGVKNIDAEFYEYLKRNGLQNDQRLLNLPIENKQLMLTQSRRMSTLSMGHSHGSSSRPGSPAPQLEEQGSKGGLFSLFTRRGSRKNSTANPSPSPTPYPPYSPAVDPPTSPRLYSHSRPTSPLQAHPPTISVTQEESLKQRFESVLNALHVQGKTREQVLGMFERAKVADQLVILDKYTKQIINSAATALDRPIAPDRGSGSLTGQPSTLPTPVQATQQYPRRDNVPAAIEGYEWVDQLHGAELDKQFEKVLNAMRLTGYSKSTVMISTQTSGKRLMIKQHYSQHNLPPPNDLPDFEEERLVSPGSPTPSSASSVSRLNSNVELFRVGDSGLPKTADFYVVQFMDQLSILSLGECAIESTSAKVLLRVLANLRLQLTLSASPIFLQQFNSQKVFIPSINQHFTGLESLRHILRRFNADSNHGNSAGAIAAVKWFRTYADNSTVRPDEIRLEVLECLAKFEPSQVINSAHLVSELIALLTTIPGDSTHSTENLTMRTHASQIGGYVSLDSDEGLDQVRDALPADLGSLVSTLVDPLTKSTPGISIQAVPVVDAALSRDVDISVLWQFRVSLLEFIIAVIGAYDDLGARMKIRKSFENAGLEFALEALSAKADTLDDEQVSGDEGEQFLELVKAFEEGKLEDLQELRENGAIERPVSRFVVGFLLVYNTAHTKPSSSPQEILESTLNIIKSLPEETALAGTLLLEHTSYLISSLTKQQQQGSVKPEDLLILSERLTYVTSIAATEPRTAANDNWATISQALVAAIESATGLTIVPVESASTTSQNKKLIEEVNELTERLGIANSLEDEYRQKSADLQELIETNKAAAAGIPTARISLDSNKDEEIKLLRERLAAMTVERDEAVRLAAEASGGSGGVGRQTTVARKATKAPKIHRSGTVVVLPRLEANPTCGSLPLKNLEWTKVQDNKVYSSVWGEVVESAYGVNGAYSNNILDATELSSLSSLFAKPDEQTSTFVMTPFSKKVILLDEKRSRQIEILLRSIRGPAPEYTRLTRQQIRDGIISMSHQVLTLDNLNILIQIVPSSAEIDLVNSFQGNPDALADGEKFIRTISSIPRLKERLECIIFQKRLSEEIVEIKPDLILVSKAAKALVGSDKFYKVLQTVLVIGNYLNGNSFRGGAYGFEMESFLRLKDTKAADGCSLKDRAPTLMHYLARRLEETDQDLLDLKSEIGVVEMASRISVESLFDSVQDLEISFSKIKTEISIIETLSQSPSTPTEDAFLHSMRQFVSEKEPLLTRLCVTSDTVANDIQNLVDHFGQEIKQDDNISNTAEKIFKNVWSFQEALVRAAGDNRAVDEKFALNTNKQNPYTRKPQLTPLQRMVLEKKERLKAVEGEKPFSLRGMTLGRSKRKPVYASAERVEEVALAAEGAAEPVSSTTPISPLKAALKNRQTLRRITKHVSVANMLKAAGRKQRESESVADEDSEKTEQVVVEGIHEVLGRYSEST